MINFLFLLSSLFSSITAWAVVEEPPKKSNIISLLSVHISTNCLINSLDLGNSNTSAPKILLIYFLSLDVSEKIKLSNTLSLSSPK